MKKWIAPVLVVLILVALAGCGSSLKEPVSFYYLRTAETIQYGAEDGMIASEEREASGHIEDLQYLLSLYLAGPLDLGLESPFPAGIKMDHLVIHRDSLVIVLSEDFSGLSGMDLTAACACLTATCFSLTDADEITIISPECGENDGVNLTFDRQSFALVDTYLPEP